MAFLLPLHEEYLRRGAAFGEVNGWILPLRFADLVEEVGAARGAAGFLDLSPSGKIRLSGNDRVRFLHRMVSNDIEKLSIGSGCYAALLDHKGHLLSDLRVLMLADELLLLTPATTTSVVRETLNRYVVADQVELQDASADWALLSVQGPHAADVYYQMTGEISATEKHSHVERELEGRLLRLIQSDHTGDRGFDILVPVEKAGPVFESVMGAGHDFGIRPIGLEAFNALRIEAGIPWYGVDMDDTHLIQEALLDEAVSFTKGCYIGQETVARVHSRGHVNKHLCGFRFEGAEPPAAGDNVFVGSEEAGWITSGVYSPSLRQPIALGYMRREASQLGTPVSVASGESTLSGKVAQLPLYQTNF